MSIVSDAVAALETALRTIDNLSVYTDLADIADPPAAFIGPPELVWQSICQEPTSATFLVFVVVALNDGALPNLWDLVPVVAAAIETAPDAVVRRATPGSLLAGSTELPCYELTVEVAL